MWKQASIKLADNSLQQDFINGDSVILLSGMPVALKSSGSVWQARADSQARAIVIGLVLRDAEPTLPVIVVTSGLLYLPNLLAGYTYYLAAIGGISESAPFTPGHSIVELGMSVDGYSLMIRIQKSILL